MQDVLIRSDKHGLYDLQIDGKDFASAQGFETVIPVSFFTDARASASMVQNARRRRGWVADSEIGGLLWLLDQARLNQDTVNLAGVYARESLQHLLDNDLATGVTVTVDQNTARGVVITTSVNVSNNQTQRYVSLWKTTDFTRIESSWD